MITNHYCKCDTCSHSRQFNNRPFAEILKVVRQIGWRVAKVPTGWHHYCPTCVKKWAKPVPPIGVENPEMWWQRD